LIPRRKPQRRPHTPSLPHQPLTKPTPAPAEAPAQGVRLQKLLAERGLGSRRQVEAWIEAGRVQLNGRRAQLGDRAGPADRILLDGEPVATTAPAGRARVLLYHKPVGEIVTRSDPGGRPTVFERLPKRDGARWAAVGRLDYNTSGLLLFTDSGELAHRLMHPSFGLEREYLARVQGALQESQLQTLRHGVELDGVPAAFERIERLRGRQQNDGERGVNHWFRVTLGEGRNREVRRLFEAVGARVSRLMRVRYGPIRLPRELEAGEWIELSGKPLAELLADSPAPNAAQGARKAPPKL
jgi:23S rRNA pseudouridine2605 synthase